MNIDYKPAGTKLADLGFGLMRLPRTGNGLDLPEIQRMTDAFLAAGYHHFDTAYMYDDGESEKAFGACVGRRIPRDRFTITSKLVAWRACTDEKSAKEEFDISLERMGVTYLDEYLMHAVRMDNYRKYDEYHIWDYMEELKASGRIRRYGMSWHASPELLDELLSRHPGVSSVQLQVNYADWNSIEVRARENLEVARRHGVAVTVMSPLRGGALAHPASVVRKQMPEDTQPLGWALRFAGSLAGVERVLTGASSLKELQENMNAYSGLLNEAEQERIRACMQAFDGMERIPCNSCHKCSEVCPQAVSIPEIFNAMNEVLLFDQKESAKGLYLRVTDGRGRGRARDCTACGMCEAYCLERIPIADWLRRCKACFDE